MPFIGNQPALSYTSFAKQDFTTSATTSYVLDNPVANANELALFINFVRQEPTTAYSASGTTLTLTSATSATDDMYCVFLGKAVQTVNPPNASVGTSQLVDGAVTKAKTSDLMYPAFEANRANDLSLTDNTTQKMTYNTEIFDTDSCYDNATNYRFTPTVAGKYYVYASLTVQASAASTLNLAFLEIHKNGTKYRGTMNNMNANFITGLTPYVGTVIDMNGSTDYLEVYVRPNISSGTVKSQGADNVFGAYRIGD